MPHVMTVTRRSFLSLSAVVVGFAALLRRLLAAAPDNARRLLGRVISSAGLPVSAGQRSPFGWTTTAIAGELNLS